MADQPKDILKVPCHRCGASEGFQCRNLRTGARFPNVDGFHKARRDLAARSGRNAEDGL